MKYINAKIGTHPMGRYKCIRKRKDPVVGDKLVLRGYDEWEDFHVRVCEIKQISETQKLYFVERF